MKRTLALLLIATLAGAGCAVTIGTRPDAYPFPTEELPEIADGSEISVTNGIDVPTSIAVGNNAFVDTQQHTETALQIVTRELRNLGVATPPEATRTMVLHIKRPAWILGTWSMQGEVALVAELGNGETLTHVGNSQTAGNAMRAFNGAILRATTALLKDPALEAYLEAPTPL